MNTEDYSWVKSFTDQLDAFRKEYWVHYDKDQNEIQVDRIKRSDAFYQVAIKGNFEAAIEKPKTTEINGEDVLKLL